MKSKHKYKVLLIYLIILTIASAGVTLSKYTTSSYGSDFARVASIGKLSITSSGIPVDEWSIPLLLAPGVDLQKDINISYDPGEISCYVFFTIDNLKASYGTYFYGDDQKTAWFSFDVNTSWNSFSKGDKRVWYCLLEPGEFFSSSVIGGDIIHVSEDFTRSDLASAGDDLRIDLSVNVVQYNGEDDPMAAYERISNTGGVKE